MILSSLLFSVSYDNQKEEPDLKQIEKIIDMYVNGILNKKSIIKLLKKNIKNIYFCNTAWDNKSIRNKDCGDLSIETEKYVVELSYERSKSRRDNNFSPTSLTFYREDFIYISFLVKEFGKWVFYSNEGRIVTKLPSFEFKKSIDNKREIIAFTWPASGPYEKPMKCYSLWFQLYMRYRFRKDKYKKALEYYKKINKNNHDISEYRYIYYNYKENNKLIFRYDKGLFNYMQKDSYYFDDPLGILGLAEVCEKAGEYEKALELFIYFAKKFPADVVDKCDVKLRINKLKALIKRNRGNKKLLKKNE
jgi:tetratricopeptide (TPR) repeat protein